jgi:D-glycero-alpha-D-manno-heptose-7-phosphate kinase
MNNELRKTLESRPTEASAPCRIDMGGTLDIPTFYYPLRHLNPCTFNIALALRTRVRLRPYNRGFIKISSRGFEDAEFPSDAAPFDHPMGLMFAAAAYFNAGGVHIDIESESPPRSGLGGSSAAAVALVAAFGKLLSSGSYPHQSLDRRHIALLAYKLEETVAGVPCGSQDQLAAAYGGVHHWLWQGRLGQSYFQRKVAVPKRYHKELERRLLLAYCGKPHVSRDINGKWVRQFLGGKNRGIWQEIIDYTHKFTAALARRDYLQAANCMNRETALRRQMTPDVLDSVGVQLVESALQSHCGARFTGAGGGGCIWALGPLENVDRLKPLWEEILSNRKQGYLLDATIDAEGVAVH